MKIFIIYSLLSLSPFLSLANATTILNDKSCFNGKYVLSPDGNLFFRLCKAKNALNIEDFHLSPSNQVISEVRSTSDFELITNLNNDNYEVSWSLDGKALYVANDLINRRSVTQYSVELLNSGSPLSNLKPNFVTTELYKNSSWVSDFQTPMIDGLMSNLGVIPIVDKHASDEYLYTLSGGENYEYNEELDSTQLTRSCKNEIFRAQKFQDSKVLKWINDPYAVPLVNLSYSPKANLLSVNVLNNSKWTETFSSLSMQLSNFKLNINEFDLFMTFSEKSIHDSKNRVFYVSNMKHNTTALYEFNLKKQTHEVLYHDARYDINKPIYTRSGNLFGVEVYKETNTFVPLTIAGEQLSKIIETRVSKEGLYDVNILSIADDSSKAIFEIRGLSYSRTFLADLKSHTSMQIANNDRILNFQTKPVWTTSSDGHKILSYFSHRKSKGFEQLPLIVEIHGGPHLRDKLHLSMISETLVASGFNLLRINYRGSKGFDKRIISTNQRNLIKRMSLDIVESLQNTIISQRLSPSKVVAFGTSFGGLLVTNLSTSEYLHKHFSAFFSVNGVSNYCDFYDRVDTWANGKWSTCTEEEDNTRTLHHNKLFYVAYGTEDQIVLPKQSEKLLYELRNFTNVKEIRLTGENHDLSQNSWLKLRNELLSCDDSPPNIFEMNEYKALF